MYQSMQYYLIPFSDNVSVRAVRSKPFKSLDAAVRALLKTGNEGYVKQQGQLRPVYHNLKVN